MTDIEIVETLKRIRHINRLPISRELVEDMITLLINAINADMPAVSKEDNK